MRKPDEKELDFYVGPEITFLGKAEELTASLCGNLTEMAGSGKWRKGAGADDSDAEAKPADDVAAYEDGGGQAETDQASTVEEADKEESQ